MEISDRLKDSTKYFGLITLAIEWSLMLFLYLSYPARFQSTTPLSDFLGLPFVRLIFITGFSLAALTFWLFVRWHLARRYNTPLRIFGISLICLIIAMVVPYAPAGTFFHLIHIFGAVVFAVGFYAAVLLMGMHNEQPFIRQLSLVITVALAIVLVGLAIFTNLKAILLFELCIGLFGHVWILLISVYSLRKPH